MISLQKPLPMTNFRDAFKRVDWEKLEEGIGFERWRFINDNNIVTILPTDETSKEYNYYQQKNIKLLLFSLGLSETEDNILEIYNQLSGYNYKLINRIVSDEDYLGNAVPFEVASNIPEMNINTFRYYYYAKRGKLMPIESFEFNHTIQGSFIIPISVIAETEEGRLWEEPSPTNKVIRDYLTDVDKLLSIRADNEEKFAEKVMAEGIDSQMVKGFLSDSTGIAKYIKRYQASVKEISITSKGSPFLDFKLSEPEKVFKKIELEQVKSVPQEYIDFLSKKEAESNEETIEESGATIDVIVDGIMHAGKAQFKVVAINKKPVKKPFVAVSVKLTKSRVDFCADALKSQGIVEVEGDIFKPKGKTGEIILDDIKNKPRTAQLFEETSDSE